jgi:hypothetical protein
MNTELDYPTNIIYNINKAQILKHENDYHKYIYYLKKKYKKNYKCFRFSGSPVAPYSELVNQCIFNLKYSGLWKYNNEYSCEVIVADPEIINDIKKEVNTPISEKAKQRNKESVGFLKKLREY